MRLHVVTTCLELLFRPLIYLQLIVVEIVDLISWLSIDVGEVVLPADLRLRLGIKVNPDKAGVIDMDMDWKQAILVLVKAW